MHKESIQVLWVEVGGVQAGFWGGERKRDGRTESSSPFLNFRKGLLEDFYVKKQDVFCFVTINPAVIFDS
jgi:hypothetical protein